MTDEIRQIPDSPVSASARSAAPMTTESWSGYRRFQLEQAAVVTPEEAGEAGQACRRALRALAGVACVAAALLVVRDRLDPAGHALAFGALGDLAAAFLLAAALWLAGRKRMPYAGRLLYLLAGATVLVRVPAPPTGPFPWDFWLEIVAPLSFFFLAGWLVDWAAHPAPAGGESRRAAALAAWGLALLAGAWAWWGWAVTARPAGAPGVWPPVALTLAAGLHLVWGFGPGIRWVRYPASVSPRAAGILAAGWRRWRHRWQGRALALAFGLLPFFLFLNNLDLADRLRLAKSAGASAGGNPGSLDFFWQDRGRMLDDASFRRNELYGWNPWTVETAFADRADGLLARVQADPRDGAAFRELRSLLAPCRITRRAEWEALKAAAENSPRLIWLRSLATRPSWQQPWPAAWHEASALEFPRLRPMDPGSVSLRLAETELSNWPLLALGVIGFILLWRRGGDAVAARWLGLWLASLAAVAAFNYAELQLPAMELVLWERAVTAGAGALALRFGGLLELALLAAQALAFSGLPLWGAWAALCWPTPPEAFPGAWRRRLVAAAKIAAVGGVMLAFGLALFGAFAWPLTWLASERTAMMAFPPVFVAAADILLIGGGALFRRRNARRSEAPRMGWPPVAAFVCAQLVVALVLVLDVPVAEAGLQTAEAVATRGLAALFFGMAMYALLRRDFLRVSAGRDFSFVVLVVALPLLFEAGKELAKEFLLHLGLVSPRGSELLALVFVVAVLEPLQRWIEEGVRYLVVRRLRRIEESIDEVLEALTEAGSREDIAAAVSRLFHQQGLERYAFYARAGRDAFQPMLQPGLEDLPPEMPVSGHLRELFAKQRRFIDLRAVAYEWPYFFHQFELARIEASTRCRYLLPVCLKSSVRGVLLLPDEPSAGELSRDALAGEINDLGVAAVQIPR